MTVIISESSARSRIVLIDRLFYNCTQHYPRQQNRNRPEDRDHEFMKRMLELIIRKWDPTKVDTGLKVLVPQDKLDEIEQYFKEKAGDLLNNGLSLKGEKDLKMGFEILPQNENYKISITDSSFEAFLNTHFNEEIISFLFKKDN